MNNAASDRLTTILLNVSLALFVIGVIFRIQHYPYGNLISLIGMGSYLFISHFEIRRLKRIIARLTADDVKV